MIKKGKLQKDLNLKQTRVTKDIQYLSSIVIVLEYENNYNELKI